MFVSIFTLIIYFVVCFSIGYVVKGFEMSGQKCTIGNIITHTVVTVFSVLKRIYKYVSNKLKNKSVNKDI